MRFNVIIFLILTQCNKVQTIAGYLANIHELEMLNYDEFSLNEPNLAFFIC